MKYAFLFDASAVIHYFMPDPELQDALAYLMALKDKKEASFFIPSFCIAETQNTFAKNYYRRNLLEKKDYEKMTSDFIDMVHNRKVFYSYDLNRYHNLNAESIFSVEHSTNTEFSFIDNQKPQGSTIKEREEDLHRLQEVMKDKGVNIGKCYLSTFDILLISMTMELKRFFGESRTFLVTKDERVANICKEGKFCNAIYLNACKDVRALQQKFK